MGLITLLIFLVSCTDNIAGEAFKFKAKAIPICVDSDGLNATVAGSVTALGVVYNDACLGDLEVFEVYCDNGRQRNTALPCQYNQYCSNGACTSICTDTDGGNNLAVSGGVFIRGIRQGVDSCSRKRSGIVEEVSTCANRNSVECKVLELDCNQNGTRKINHLENCPNGCANGVCY